MTWDPESIALLAGKIGAVVAVAWKVVWPLMRDWKGKGADPSMRQLLEQVANNTTLLCHDTVPALRADVTALKGQVSEVKHRLATVERTLDGDVGDVKTRLYRVEKLTPGLK